MEWKIFGLAAANLWSPGGGIPSWKRVLDSVVIVAASPLILPVTLLIALYIKLVSRGPVLFRQERIGYYGQPFTIFKFRTMRVNAPTACHQEYLKELMRSSKPMAKMDAKGDDRVIRGGVFLRATGLDELPQLINVLRGEMSLVGPRPCTPYEYEQYSPWHSRRLETLPGLTGLWQVSGKNRVSFEKMIQLDIHYAEHNSAWLDLQIMLKTVPVLFSQAAEVVSRRACAWRFSRRDAGLPAAAAPLAVERRLPTEGSRFRSIRTQKEKKCQTRLTLESSVVDTGART